MQKNGDLFLSESARADLKSKTVKGAAIAGATQVIRVGLGLVTVPLLARLLDPGDFGMFAIVAVLTNFALMFVDAGLSMATVQQAEVSRQQVSNLFWVSTGLGLAIAAAVSITGPCLAWAYYEPRLMWLTLACSTTYIFTGLTVQHQALLRRNMMFDRIAAVEITSMFAGQAAAIFWAWRFYSQSVDFWALAWVPIITSFTRMIGVWIACRWLPSWYARKEKTGDMLRFGGNLTFGQAFNYVGANADLMLVGYCFGDTVLGKYDRSSMLSVQPIRQINGPLSSVCVPALSRLIKSPKKYRSAFRTATSIVATVIMPIAAVCIVDADRVIGLMLGSGWEDAVSIFQILSVMMLTLPLCNASVWLLISQGRGKETLRFQIIDTALKLALIAIAIPWGVIGVAIACVTRAIIIPPLLFFQIGRTGSIRASQLWYLFLIQISAFAFSAMTLWLMNQQDMLLRDSPTLRLFASCLVSVACSTSVMMSFPSVRHGIKEVVSVFMLTRLQTRSPAS